MKKATQAITQEYLIEHGFECYDGVDGVWKKKLHRCFMEEDEASWVYDSSKNIAYLVNDPSGMFWRTRNEGKPVMLKYHKQVPIKSTEDLEKYMNKTFHYGF